jgi:hypothetical protein
MAKVKIQGNASGTGVLTITAPNTSTDRTITLPDSTGTILDNTSTLDATKLSGNLPAISGASLTNVNSVNSGRKNLIINGAMQVAQRSTSAVAQANDSNEGYATLDRYSLEFGNSAGGTITTSKDSESPTGFGSSYKLNVTTADTSVDTNHLVFFAQCIEAQTLRSCGWDYTSASSYLTLSFWVKNSKTGIYCVAFNTYDTARQYTAEYTISQANTWEKKTITIPGNSALTFNDDNGAGLEVHFMLANASGRYGSAGSWTSGNAWGTSNQVNFLDSTSNVGYWTGIQLEVGSTATDFEHRSYGEELALCQRYYERFIADASAEMLIGVGVNASATDVFINYPYKQIKRVIPSFSSSGASHFERLTASWGAGSSINCQANIATARLNMGGFPSSTIWNATEVRITAAANDAHWFAFDAEL